MMSWEGVLPDQETAKDLRHCIACEAFRNNINDEPCRTCLHTGDPPGRLRPLWIYRSDWKRLAPVMEVKPQYTPEPGLYEQMTLF